jgi:hypothetical protein
MNRSYPPPPEARTASPSSHLFLRSALRLAIPTRPSIGQNTIPSPAILLSSLFPSDISLYLGQIGNAPRRFFYGPGLDNCDMAIEKQLVLREGKSLDFRMEAFNVFNHAQFFGAATVNGNISSAAFGQIVSAQPPILMQSAVKFQF